MVHISGIIETGKGTFRATERKGANQSESGCSSAVYDIIAGMEPETSKVMIAEIAFGRMFSQEIAVMRRA